MRRSSSWLPFLAVAAVLAVGSGCGVTADTSAATVAGREVSAEAVEELARDEVFLGPGGVELNESRLPGDVARSVLLFEIERVAWLAELDRWGVELDGAARDAASQQLDDQLASAGGGDFSDETRGRLIDYLAAQEVLAGRFAAIDPGSDEDLRRLFEAAPPLWERACVVVVQVPTAAADAVQEALDGGGSIEQLPERVEGAQIVADPTQGCTSLFQLPDELRRAVESTGPGERSEVLTVGEGPLASGFVLRVEERQSLSFAAAREELVAIAESLREQGPPPWIQLLVASAEITPRFGSGMATTPEGQPVIEPPPLPIAPPGAAPALEPELLGPEPGADDPARPALSPAARP